MPASSRQVMAASRMVQSPNIVEIAVSNDDFSTLVAAVKSAGLVEALSADGPVTEKTGTKKKKKTQDTKESEVKK